MRLGDLDALKEDLINRLSEDDSRIIEIIEEEIDNAPTVVSISCDGCKYKNLPDRNSPCLECVRSYCYKDYYKRGEEA